MTTLENDLLKINIATHGAELQNIVNKSTGQEIIWQGDPKHWGRRAPVLFPIIGGLKDDGFIYESKIYQQSKHGFGRNSVFDLISADGRQATFSLQNSEDTLVGYPFNFQVIIRYELSNNQLINHYEVTNPSKDPLYFSIGGHPAFNCPVNSNDKRSEYSLVFDQVETAYSKRINMQSGLRTGEEFLIMDQTETLPISNNLFDEDALVFHQMKSTHVSLYKQDQKYWTFDFGEFPYLGIWSASPESPFVCIEPWFGVCDLHDHNQQLTEKEGIVRLEPQTTHKSKFIVTVH